MKINKKILVVLLILFSFALIAHWAHDTSDIIRTNQTERTLLLDQEFERALEDGLGI
jgi:hypothetical protein